MSKTMHTPEEELRQLKAVSRELADLLRKYWKTPDYDTETLLLTAIVSGIVDAWSANPPENGIVCAPVFPNIGRVEISIRRISGQSSAQSINERDKRIAELEERQAELLESLKAFSVTEEL